jgi:hypothetical protein
VTVLNKAEKAPCRGYLFSPEKEKEVYIKIEENKLLKKEIELKDLKIEFFLTDVKDVEAISKREAEKAELWRVRAEDSTKKLVESESKRGMRDILFLILGIGLTLGAGVAMGAAAK